MRAAEAPIAWMARGYEATLGWALRRQGLMLLVTLGTLGLTVYLYIIVPKGFLPAQDTGLLDVVLEGSPAASFAEMSRLQDQAAAALRQDPDVTGVVAVLGVGTLNPTANVAAPAGHADARRRAQRDDARRVAERLRAALGRIPGVTALRQAGAGHPDRHAGEPLAIPVHADRAPTRRGAAPGRTSCSRGCGATPALAHVAAETQNGGLRAFVDIDREKAGRLGVTTQMIDDTLNDAFGQRQISTIYAQSNQYRVILEAAPALPDRPERARQALCRHRRRRCARGARSSSLARRLHARRTRARCRSPTRSSSRPPRSASTSPRAPRSARRSQAIARGRAGHRHAGLDHRHLRGGRGRVQQSLASEPWLILAAVVTIYLVLGVLYESFIHPLTILSTLPSAGVGALLALMVCGQDLSIVALIGIILLMGIVKKNAIMMIDFALEAERDDGLAPRGRDRAGLPPALPPDHDDDARGAVRRAAAGARARHRARSCACRSASPSSAACCLASC